MSENDVLAFPNPYIEWRPKPRAGLVTIDFAEGGGWPSTIVAGWTMPEMTNALVEADPRLIIPLSEDAVVPVALAGAHLGPERCRTVPKAAALAVTHRLALRRALEPHGLNPPWSRWGQPLPSGPPWVVKSDSSWLSLGVEVIEADTDLEAAQARVSRKAYLARDRLVPWMIDDLEFSGLYESFVEGPQFCVSGIVREDVEHVFAPIRQVWDLQRRFIFRYELATEHMADLETVGVVAARALGLRWCAFNFEVRGVPGSWRVLDAHARLGEDDGGYMQLLGGGHDANEILVETLCR